MCTALSCRSSFDATGKICAGKYSEISPDYINGGVMPSPEQHAAYGLLNRCDLAQDAFVDVSPLVYENEL